MKCSGTRVVGENIVLRAWRATDVDWYERCVTSNLDWLKYESPWLLGDYDFIADVDNIKTRTRQCPDETIPCNLLIATKSTDLPIGFVNSYWRSRQTNWLRIGIRILDPLQWKRGCGSEALSLWIEYQFEQRAELMRIGFTTWSGNIGIVKIANKLGFIEEARHRKARSFNGAEYDALGFGILREEWYAQKYRFPRGVCLNQSALHKQGEQ